MSRDTTPYIFVSADPQSIVEELTAKYESIAQRTVHPASPEKLFIQWVAATMVLLAEQITTISRSAFRNCLGRIRDQGKLAEIEAAVLAQTGIGQPKSGDYADTDEAGEPGENMGNDTDDQEDL